MQAGLGGGEGCRAGLTWKSRARCGGPQVRQEAVTATTCHPTVCSQHRVWPSDDNLALFSAGGQRSRIKVKRADSSYFLVFPHFQPLPTFPSSCPLPAASRHCLLPHFLCLSSSTLLHVSTLTMMTNAGPRTHSTPRLQSCGQPQ